MLSLIAHIKAVADLQEREDEQKQTEVEVQGEN